MLKINKRNRILSLILALVLLIGGLGVSPVKAVSSNFATERLSGADREEVAASVAKKFFADADKVVVVNYLAFADAISATNLTKGKAPILYCRADSLSSKTIEAIKAIKPSSIEIMGGTNSVSEKVENELKGLGTVTRISGRDRYEVSAKAAARVGDVSKVVVTTGSVYSDALVAAPYANKKSAAILLVNPALRNNGSALDTFAADFLKAAVAKGTSTVDIIGGPNSISNKHASLIQGIVNAEPKRISGADRYAVSANVAKDLFADASTAIYASGEVFSDALVAAPLAQKNNAPILLMRKNAVIGEVVDYLKNNKELNKAYVIGGPNTIWESLITKINEALGASSSDGPDIAAGPNTVVDVNKLPKAVKEKLPTLKKDMDTTGYAEFVAALNERRTKGGDDPVKYDPNLSIEAAYIGLTLQETGKLPTGGQYHSGDEYYYIAPIQGISPNLMDNVSHVYGNEGSESLVTHIGLAKYNGRYYFYVAGNLDDTTKQGFKKIMDGSQDADKAQEMLNLVNSYRAGKGLGKLKNDPVLTKLAQARAQEATGLMSHTRPDGSNYKDEFNKTSMYSYMGESLGSAPSAEQMFNDYVDHRPHRAIIENELYTNVGVACFKASNGRYYWDVVFGKEGSKYTTSFKLKDLSSKY